jgi:hypothetical protein
MSKFCCLKCKYFTDTSGHLKQHLSTKKHLNKDTTISPFKCSKCEKEYLSQSGLRKHKLNCKAVESVVAVSKVPELVSQDLHAEIVNLKGMIIELVKNQQPTTINNNNNNYINIFLNDKCRNACDIRKFIAGIA